jgi:hypothetical protein
VALTGDDRCIRRLMRITNAVTLREDILKRNARGRVRRFGSGNLNIEAYTNLNPRTVSNLAARQ